MKFKIGRNCVVDPAANQIFIRNGAGEQTARLEPRMMRVLVLLADQPGEVLSREFLIETIWENKFVGEEALTQAISRLRKVFGDNPHQPQFIETIPKNGYRKMDTASLPILHGIMTLKYPRSMADRRKSIEIVACEFLPYHLSQSPL